MKKMSMARRQNMLRAILSVALAVVSLCLSCSPMILAKSIPTSKEGLNFGMLPKGVPIPPSGPSGRSNVPPPPPPPSVSRRQALNFGMLPKGVPVPPSGPSDRSSDTPPPPPIGN